jgi:hypothetical protein
VLDVKSIYWFTTPTRDRGYFYHPYYLWCSDTLYVNEEGFRLFKEYLKDSFGSGRGRTIDNDTEFGSTLDIFDN